MPQFETLASPDAVAVESAAELHNVPEEVVTENTNPAVHAEIPRLEEKHDPNRLITIMGEQMTLADAIKRCSHLSGLSKDALEATLDKNLDLLDQSEKRRSEAAKMSDEEREAAARSAKEAARARLDAARKSRDEARKAAAEAQQAEKDLKPIKPADNSKDAVAKQDHSKTETKAEKEPRKVQPEKAQTAKTAEPSELKKPPTIEAAVTIVKATPAEAPAPLPRTVQDPKPETLPKVQPIIEVVETSAKAVIPDHEQAQLIIDVPIQTVTEAPPMPVVETTVRQAVLEELQHGSPEPILPTPTDIPELVFATAASEEATFSQQSWQEIPTPTLQEILDLPSDPAAETDSLAAELLLPAPTIEDITVDAYDFEKFELATSPAGTAYAPDELEENDPPQISDEELSEIISTWMSEAYDPAAEDMDDNTVEPVFESPDMHVDMTTAPADHSDQEISPTSLDLVETTLETAPVTVLDTPEDNFATDEPVKVEIETFVAAFADTIGAIEPDQEPQVIEQLNIIIEAIEAIQMPAVQPVAESIETEVNPDMPAVTVELDTPEVEQLIVALQQLFTSIGLHYEPADIKKLVTMLVQPGDAIITPTSESNIDIPHDRGTHESLQWFMSQIKAIRQQTSDRRQLIGKLAMLFGPQLQFQLQAA